MLGHEKGQERTSEKYADHQHAGTLVEAAQKKEGDSFGQTGMHHRTGKDKDTQQKENRAVAKVGKNPVLIHNLQGREQDDSRQAGGSQWYGGKNP